MIFFTKESKTKRLLSLTSQKIKELKSKLQTLDQDINAISTNIKKKLFTKNEIKSNCLKAQNQLLEYIDEYELIKKDERNIKILINSVEDYQIKFKLENSAKNLSEHRHNISEILYYLKRKVYNVSEYYRSRVNLYAFVFVIFLLICFISYLAWNYTTLLNGLKKIK